MLCASSGFPFVRKITFADGAGQSSKEIAYFKKLLKLPIDWSGIARFHDVVSTSMGEGVVYELVRDYDGSVSKSLSSYLQEGSLTNADVGRALGDLHDYLLRNRIIFRDMRAENLLFRKAGDGGGCLVAIDGLGCNEFIPLSTIFGFFAERKIKRKWKRFMRGLASMYPSFFP